MRRRRTWPANSIVRLCRCARAAAWLAAVPRATGMPQAPANEPGWQPPRLHGLKALVLLGSVMRTGAHTR